MAEQFFVRLLGTRPDWPEKMTKREEQIMQRHFSYLERLIAKKKVLMAGPVFENAFGLVILNVTSQEEAVALMDKEPSVLDGVHTYELSPMRVSLQAHHVPTTRYPDPLTDRALYKTTEVAASIKEVWRAWTTAEGIQSFLSIEARVELRIGGPMEIYFAPDAPAGERGSEDCTILAFEPPALLCFEWNAPPDFSEQRDQRTMVIVRLEAVGDERTGVSLTHRGWGEGQKWDEVYAYFDRAWSFVLAKLKDHFEPNRT